MANKNAGASFQIVVDGKSLSYRDAMETALEAGMFLKERCPQSEIVVRDLKNGAQTIIGWKSGKVFSPELASCDQSAPRSNWSCGRRLPPRESDGPLHFSARSARQTESFGPGFPPGFSATPTRSVAPSRD
jgi:hypothetical protein